MGGHITSISGDSDFALVQVQYDDKKSIDPSLSPSALDVKDAKHASDALSKSAQRAADTIGKNLRADKDATTGKTDSQIAMEQRVHAITHDGIVPAEQGHRQLQALASIHSRELDPPTQRVASLENRNIRDFDHTQRA